MSVVVCCGRLWFVVDKMTDVAELDKASGMNNQIFSKHLHLACNSFVYKC